MEKSPDPRAPELQKWGLLLERGFLEGGDGETRPQGLVENGAGFTPGGL